MSFFAANKVNILYNVHSKITKNKEKSNANILIASKDKSIMMTQPPFNPLIPSQN